MIRGPRSPACPSAAEISLLTYNIRLGLERGLEAVAGAIERSGAEVVALQEVGSSWTLGPPGPAAAALASRLGYPYAIFGGALFDGGGAYGIALLSRHPIVAARRMALPRAADEERILLSLELATPTPLRLWTTHLSVREEDRAMQLAWIADRLPEAAPDLLLGDLNTGPDDPGVARLPLRNAWGADPVPTYPTTAPLYTLDHVLYGPRCALVEPARALLAAGSDHLPVRATVEVIASTSDGAQFCPQVGGKLGESS